MGLFNWKEKIGTKVTNETQAASHETVGWVLRGGGSREFNADPRWAETIRNSTPKIARVGHVVTVELRRNKAKSVTVWHDGQEVGAMFPQDSKAYESAFAALERTKRHGIVEARIEPVDWKSGGIAIIEIAPPQRPCIPFNQPPLNMPRAGRADFEIKDEAKFKDFIVRISRQMNASPGYFVIAPADSSGFHPVYAPMAGVPHTATQVGYVNKAGTKAASEVTVNGPVFLPGIVWWRDKVPQIELSSWHG